jgi:outer membrane lipoprotein-sorting protein
MKIRTRGILFWTSGATDRLMGLVEIRPLSSIILTLALVAALACLPGSGREGTGNGADLRPEEVLAKSRDATSELQSFRITGNIVVDSEEGVQEARIWQEWATPDRWHMKLKSPDEAVDQFNEVIIAEGRVFTRESDSNSQAWREQTVGVDSWTLSRNTDSFIPADLEDVKLIEDDEVNGIPVFQLTGKKVQARPVPESAMDESRPAQKETVTLYTFLISKEDFRVVRTITEHDFGSTLQHTTMDFYDYNQPIKIEVPELAVE